jgi:hypothetical protein
MTSNTEDLDSEVTTDTASELGHSWSPNYDEQRSGHKYPITNIYLPKDVLVHIFQFFSLKDLHSGRVGKISTTWLKASLSVECSRYWNRPGAVFVYDNAVLDTITGDVIYDFNDIAVSSAIFNHFSDDKLCLTYDNVPYRFQNLDSKRIGGSVYLGASDIAKLAELSNEVSNETNKNSKTAPTPRSHALPIGPADMCEISYERLNCAFKYLHDGRYLYILFGNSLACVDLMMNNVKWKSQLLEKTPRYLFVNEFSQNSRSIYIALSHNAMSFEKSDGNKTELVLSNMINKKKGEVIRDLCVDNDMVAIMYANNIVVDKDIDFSVINYEGYFREIMSGPGRKSEEQGMINIEEETEEDLQPTEAHVLPISRTSTIHSTPGSATSRKRTLLAMGALEAPKLYLYDGKNNFIVGANLQRRDRYRFLKTGKTSPVFCIVNDGDLEIRVINAQGRRAHVIDLKRECQKLSLERIEFVPRAGGERFLVMGKYGGKDWWLIHPESGRVLDLSTLLLPTVEHERLFVVETKEGHLRGLIDIAGKEIIYYEVEVEKARLSGDLNTPTSDKDRGNTSTDVLQHQQSTLENDLNNNTSLTNRRFVKKWSTTLQWKTNYYQYELDPDHTRFYKSEDGNKFVITRIVQDARRFLSSQQRLDIEIIVFDRGGTILWRLIHECYYGGSEAAEKGFELILMGDQLFAVSFFVPLHTVKKGLSFLTSYDLETGRVKWKYSHKHKPNVMHDILQTTRRNREENEMARKKLLQTMQGSPPNSEGDLTPKGRSHDETSFPTIQLGTRPSNSDPSISLQISSDSPKHKGLSKLNGQKKKERCKVQ